MIRVLAVICLLGVAACGADGEPVKPDASVGVGVGSSGVNSSATVGISRGPARVGISLF